MPFLVRSKLTVDEDQQETWEHGRRRHRVYYKKDDHFGVKSGLNLDLFLATSGGCVRGVRRVRMSAIRIDLWSEGNFNNSQSCGYWICCQVTSVELFV